MDFLNRLTSFARLLKTVNFLLVFILVGVIFVQPVYSANSKALPSRNKMIIRRLRVDLKAVKKRNSRLKRRLNKLHRKTNKLLQRLRRVEKRCNRKEGTRVDSQSVQANTEPRDEILKRYSFSPQPDTPNREDRKREIRMLRKRIVGVNKPNPGLKWEYGPHRSYPVLREPLSVKIKKVITNIDSLTRLAHQFYLDARYWKLLHEYNRDRLNSPDNLPTGKKIILPSLEELKSQ